MDEPKQIVCLDEAKRTTKPMRDVETEPTAKENQKNLLCFIESDFGKEVYCSSLLMLLQFLNMTYALEPTG
jgi:hypothetical protein